MKQLKKYMLTGVFFVIILGTLAHFLYEWSKNNIIIGCFVPVNESTWEHMKLLFFPMLIYSIFAFFKLKDNYPCIKSSLLSGILIGTILIPVIFYTYTGILGFNVFVLDLFTFVISVFFAFYMAYRLTLSCKMNRFLIPLYFVVVVLLVCFILFTFKHPDIALFKYPDNNICFYLYLMPYL